MEYPADFPHQVEVTDQLIDISGFSDTWRAHVQVLAAEIASAYRESGKERFIIAIGGASGSGKSTTVAVIQHLLCQAAIPVVAASQDGYHFPHEYLMHTLDADGHPLAEHKGRYDSFDVPLMRDDIMRFHAGESLSFPRYSRRIHDPIAAAIPVTGPALLLFEGLWLLYDETPWNTLLPLYDLTVFFHADADMRRQNTIARHIRGAEHTPLDAEQFYESSDAQNAELILKTIAPYDLDFHTE